MMREKDKKCGPVKVRLAPLPTRNLNFGNSLNLAECLNRSVALDRPSSRMSDLSNFSTQSMISVARSNYEQQSDELRRSMNRRNVIEALRMKDLRRKRPTNYLNENADNYSVDLAFNNQTKRKRGAYEDNESDLDCSFNRQNKSKFARSTNLQIPSRNRFVSSQFKNNEIASSYFSMNTDQQMNRSNNANKINNVNLNSSMIKQQSLKRSFQDSTDIKKLFKVPSITITRDSSLKENTNVSNTSLSNASISPISSAKKSFEHSSANISSSDSFKSLDNSRNQSVENDLLMEISMANKNTNDKQEEEKKNDDLTRIKDKEKDQSFYKIPEHFHSIDEHLRDENKARSRLGNFLKAIYKVTSPFISRNNALTTEANDNKLVSSTVTTNSSMTFPSIIPPTSKPNDSILKLPNSNELNKNNSTSTPLKVTFNLPPSTDKSSDQKAFLNSTFKFGQTNEQTNKAKPTSSSVTSSLFTFGAGNDSNNKPKEDLNKTTNTLSSSTAIPTTALSTNKTSNFTFGLQTKQDTTSKDTTSVTPFAINLPTTSSFNLNPVTTTPSNSMFALGQPTNVLASNNKQDSDKSFVFKFGSENTSNLSNNSTLKPAVAPVFNFGQSSTTTNNSKSNLSSSSFSFGESNQNNQSGNSSLLKPTLNSSAFSFGTEKQNSNMLSNSKPLMNSGAFTFGNTDNSNNNSMFKAPSIGTFGASSDQSKIKPATSLPNFSFGPTDLSIKPKDNQMLSTNNSLSTGNSGFKFNLNPTLNNNMNSTANSGAAFNFGATNSSTNFSIQNTSTPFKFDANNTQTKPSFNFGNNTASVTNKPLQPAFNFGSSANNFPQFSSTTNDTNNSSTFTAFNSTVKSNIFNIGRK